MYSKAEIDAYYPKIDYEKIPSLQWFSDDLRLHSLELVDGGHSIEFAQAVGDAAWHREHDRVMDMLETRDRARELYGMTPAQIIDTVIDE